MSLTTRQRSSTTHSSQVSTTCFIVEVFHSPHLQLLCRSKHCAHQAPCTCSKLEAQVEPAMRPSKATVVMKRRQDASCCPGAAGCCIAPHVLMQKPSPTECLNTAGLRCKPMPAHTLAGCCQTGAVESKNGSAPHAAASTAASADVKLHGCAAALLCHCPCQGWV